MESVAMGVRWEDCEKYHMNAPPPPPHRIADCRLRIADRPGEPPTPRTCGSIPQSAIRNPQSQSRDLVLPLRNLASTPRGPTSRSSCGVAPATRRAAPARWLEDAYPRIRTTCRTL